MTLLTARRPVVLAAVALAATLLIGGVPAVAPTAAAAADRDLTLVSNAGYDVQPARASVRVTVNIAAHNNRREMKTRRFFVDHAFLAVQPSTTGFTVRGDHAPRVRVARRTATYTLLRIDLGSRLFGGQRARWQLRFDLRDPGGVATRETRIGTALAAFPVWAFASDGASGSTVSVAFPKGYQVNVESGSLPRRTTARNGSIMLASGPLAKPTRFFAYVVGERPAVFATTPLTVPVGTGQAQLTVSAWKDDAAWAKRVGTVARTGLPRLADDIGLAWPTPEPITVEETLSRSANAFGGLYDPAAKRMQIAYYADPFVVLHETAHAWFNGSLLADRWANEAFASLYAQRAAKAMNLDVPKIALTDELRKSTIPLNAWPAQQAPPAGAQGPGAPGSSPGSGTAPNAAVGNAATESYAYAASLELARAIADRAGDDALQKVWGAAAAHIGAYQPGTIPGATSTTATVTTTAPETLDGPPDWRGLLDLLEEQTGKSFDDLWRTWVVRPEEASLLDARAAARDSYARTVRLAGDWQIPRAARDAMRAWQFDAAEAYLADARTVIAQRDAVAQAASRLGVQLPDTVRPLFENGSLVDASHQAAAELDAIRTVATGSAAQPVALDPLQQLGLVGQHPEQRVAVAHDALAKGDLQTATTASSDARAMWDGAWEEGRRRALIGIAAIALLVIVGSALVGFGWRRATRRLGRGTTATDAG